MRLERIGFEDVDWAVLDRAPDRSVFQTREWLEFVVATQGGEPVVARLKDGAETVGWFSGVVVKRYGVRILGSPFQGWTTGPMGFNLADAASRPRAIDALTTFAFDELNCLHLELLDRRVAFDDLAGLRVDATEFQTFEVDLTSSEEEIFARMSSACRRAVRKSEKLGVLVEEASGDGFAEEYYAQLEDVFAKQSLRPPYSVDRVRQVIEHLEPTGRLLLLRALSPEGEPVASAIFPTFGSFAYFWGGASWRSGQHLRPNEAVFWHAMRELKRRGTPLLDLGGGGEYKRKYGVREVRIPFVRKSRVPGLMALRNAAARVYWRSATRRR